MKRQISKLLPKVLVLSGALLLGWTARAQTAAAPSPEMQQPSDEYSNSDTTHPRGMHRHWAGRNGHDSLSQREGNRGMARGESRQFSRGREFRGGHGQRGERGTVRFTPEQRQQVMAINKDYRIKSADLYKRDNSTLKEYKAGLLALQKEKKGKIDGLLTQDQKDQRTARMKRMSENIQVKAAAHMERLKLRLNLTDDQVSRIRAGQADLQKQATAIHQNDNLLPREKMEQMRSLMTKRKDLVKSVLTADQQAQYEKMSHRRSGGSDRWQGRS